MRTVAAAAHTGEIGDGKIFIAPIADVVRMCVLVFLSSLLWPLLLVLLLLWRRRLRDSAVAAPCARARSSPTQPNHTRPHAHYATHHSRTAETGAVAERMEGGLEDIAASGTDSD